MPASEYRVRIVENQPLTADIRFLRVEAIAPESFAAEAGGWMQWRIPGADGTLLKRCFSIASAPSETKFMEFIIRRTPAGEGTKWIFQEGTPGTELTLWGPAGKFRLQNNSNPCVMVAGGSGLSAIRSLILAIRDQKLAKPVTLFFGAVNKSQLYMLDELAQLAQQLPNFRFVPALSQPAPEDNWDGETGLVTEVLERFLKGTDTSQLEAYLCGSPGMLEACANVFASAAVPAERVYFDKFVSPAK